MLVTEALKASGHQDKVKIAMDCAASEFYSEWCSGGGVQWCSECSCVVLCGVLQGAAVKGGWCSYAVLCEALVRDVARRGLRAIPVCCSPRLRAAFGGTGATARAHTLMRPYITHKTARAPSAWLHRHPYRTHHTASSPPLYRRRHRLQVRPGLQV